MRNLGKGVLAGAWRSPRSWANPLWEWGRWKLKRTSGAAPSSFASCTNCACTTLGGSHTCCDFTAPFTRCERSSRHCDLLSFSVSLALGSHLEGSSYRPQTDSFPSSRPSRPVNADTATKTVKRWMVVPAWGIDDPIEHRLTEGSSALVLLLFPSPQPLSLSSSSASQRCQFLKLHYQVFENMTCLKNTILQLVTEDARKEHNHNGFPFPGGGGRLPMWPWRCGMAVISATL